MTKPISRIAPVILALGVSLTFASGALAHHGWSGYDETKPLNLTGTIRDSGYDNPHGFVELEVAGTPAKTWHVVLAPPSRMETRGLPKQMLRKHARWFQTVLIPASPKRLYAPSYGCSRGPCFHVNPL